MIRSLAAPILLVALIACGGGESGSSIPPPVGTPPPPPPPPPPGNGDSPADPDNVCTDAEFGSDTAYPARARVSIGDAIVPPGASEAHVPVTLDRPTPNTVVARVLSRNGSGPSAATEGRDFRRTEQFVIFRPGDPLEQTVRVPLLDIGDGRSFDLIFRESVSGGNNGDGIGRIMAQAGAAPGVPRNDGFRAPLGFAARGTQVYTLDPASMKWSDAGGPEVWTTRLPNGRAQTANDETGLYLDPVLHQPPLAPFGIENGDLVIRSQSLPVPIEYGGTLWNYGAAVLTGQRMPSTQISYGQYEWEAMMPNRRGGWPALWLLSTSGCFFEVDVYEGFAYSADFDISRHYAANIHAGKNGTRLFTALMRVDAGGAYGLSGFDTSYHRYAVDIAPDFITWFVDGKEVYQTVNPFPATTWFPLMNVAVKTTGDYSGGMAEMRVRSFAVRRAGG